MMVKKANAVLGIISVFLIAAHSVSMGLLLCGAINYSPYMSIVGRIFLSFFCLHTLFSILIMFFNKSDGGRFYPLQNIKTVVQRVSAILLLVIIHFHFFTYRNYTEAPSAISFLPELLLLAAVTIHSVISSERAYITLGICKKPIVMATRVLLLASAAIALFGLILYFLI